MSESGGKRNVFHKSWVIQWQEGKWMKQITSWKSALEKRKRLAKKRERWEIFQLFFQSIEAKKKQGEKLLRVWGWVRKEKYELYTLYYNFSIGVEMFLHATQRQKTFWGRDVENVKNISAYCQVKPHWETLLEICWSLDKKIIYEEWDWDLLRMKRKKVGQLREIVDFFCVALFPAQSAKFTIFWLGNGIVTIHLNWDFLLFFWIYKATG